MMLRVTGKLGTFSGHPMLEHFRFVKEHTRQTPKMTIPSPSSLHFRYGRSAVPEAIYPDMNEFYRDLGQTYRKAVRGFADAGCRYIQLDEVNFTYLCDPALRKQVSERGDDVERLPHIYADMINAAIADAPADMMTAMHLCRGNFQSTFVASGGYEPVAEILFNAIKIQAYFMEYDSDRAGGFEPLRFVPKGKTGGARPGDVEVRQARIQGRAQAPHRRGGEIHCRSISFACRRNAASPRPRRATSWPRRSNGRSCAGSSKWRTRCGARFECCVTSRRFAPTRSAACCAPPR